MEIMSADEKLSSIVKRWFMDMPLLFNTYCTHKIEKNDDMVLMFRTGDGIIQYNSRLVAAFPESEVELRLKGEIYRILLKHPYQRMPEFPNLVALSRASDSVLYWTTEDMRKIYRNPMDFNLQFNYCYEQFYEKFKMFCPSNEDIRDSKKKKQKIPSEEAMKKDKKKKDAEEMMQSNQALYEQSGLWHENEQIIEAVNNEIQKANRSGDWIGIPAVLVEEIKASLEVKVDYKRMLSLFHSTVLSEKRRLTRMKPSRRYDDYMGSCYDQSRLLIAVDDSGSITNEELARFLSVVNKLFRYGVEEIRIITFDTIIQDEFDIKKATANFKLKGRGDTNFQAPIDYCKKHPEFDGLIIFTDGYAEMPKLERPMKIMWVFTNKLTYDLAKDTIRDMKGSKGCWVRLDGMGE